MNSTKKYWLVLFVLSVASLLAAAVTLALKLDIRVQYGSCILYALFTSGKLIFEFFFLDLRDNA